VQRKAPLTHAEPARQSVASTHIDPSGKPGPHVPLTQRLAHSASSAHVIPSARS